MQVEKNVKAPHGAKYLRDFMSELPNGILNKVETGCGATTVALINPENTIICCPNKQMIINKQNQYPNEELGCPYTILGVMQGVYKEDIQQYVEECISKGHPVKIMVTYNSFYKVKEAIHEIGDYRIVVDEYQALLKEYSFRDKDIRRLLKGIRGLVKVTFLSATPVPYGFIPDELKDLDCYRIDWGQTVMCKPIRRVTNKPYQAAIKMILDHKAGALGIEIEGNKPEELYLYINSVRGIKAIIEGAGLTNEQVRVICSDSDENRKTLAEIGIEISTTASPNKPYTFCTSTVFCGSDFYSTSGLTVIVSDGRNSNTRLDIATDVLQIAGRIRNEDNPFRYMLLHIYNTGSTSQTREGLDAYIQKRIHSAEVMIKVFNLGDEKDKEAIAERIKMQDEDEFAMYDEDTNTLSINQMKANYLRYKFETIDEVYRNGVAIREAYAKAGMDVSTAYQWQYIAEEYLESITTSNSFRNLYLEYLEELKKSVFGQRTQRAKFIEGKYPTIYRITEYLTTEEVKGLHYNITLVNDLLHYKLPKTQDAVKARLERLYKTSGFYPLKYIKSEFSRLYNSLGIKIKPSASDIKQYYEVQEAQETNRGKRVHGYRIVEKCFCIFHIPSSSTYKLSA